MTNPDMKISIRSIDHIVMTCRDVNVTAAFYCKLGLRLEGFGDEGQVRRALLFGDQKINLHQLGKEFEPKAQHPTPGSQDLCFVVEEDLEEAIKYLHFLQVPIILGPVERTGARGMMDSIYVRDPDNNLIEFASYRRLTSK